MQKLTIVDSMQIMAKSLQKPCMYIGIMSEDFFELEKAAPYLNLEEDSQIIYDGKGIIVFDTEEEMEKTYRMTIGDDGPTELNSYDGKCRVYALTCDKNGNLINENT